jgi:hypothetical protein
MPREVAAELGLAAAKRKDQGRPNFTSFFSSTCLHTLLVSKEQQPYTGVPQAFWCIRHPKQFIGG